ncbi:ABC transporter permease [Clostridium sp. 'White wine YQ']|uniref:ABC transporter permease n=1 Tax=Clostridium sp. 'White wine YQ' TaxID=3027474 RepID=UPI002365FF42|nr:ABC transporter permease [Clostridium sp. 'White wine YQ']MDD7794014.1 ABC transporter permease [Clostridium sp. 'White wine YQ']
MEFSKELFEPLSSEEKKIEQIARPSVTYWQDAWRRLKGNKVALISLVVIVIITLLAIFVPSFSKFDYANNDLNAANLKPSGTHWFGTDQLGRDVFVRCMYGARYSMIIAFVSVVINIVIGIIYGGISGYFGGRIDNIMMRIVDILYAIPTTIIVVLLMTVLSKPGESGGSDLTSIIIALAVTYWLNMARIVRGEILQLKNQEFVLAAKTLGASGSRIIFRHLIPNAMGSIIVTMTLLIPSAIFTEAFLSFIGLGISAPKASLGTLASDAMGAIYLFPYQLFFPSLMICLIILAFNLFGDGLSDALDPKMRK